jgi:hypothetical protein
MTHKSLLASLVYILCKANNMTCTPASLAAASECYRCSMTEKSLLAAAVYILCTSGGGGSGGGTILTGAGAPVADPGVTNAVYTDTNTGNIYSWYAGAWHLSSGGAALQQIYQDHTGSAPADPTKPAISFPTGGGGISEWNVASQTWI